MSSDPAPRPLPRVIWLAAFVGLAALIVAGYFSFRQATPATPPLEKYGAAPSFTFTSQEDAPVSNADLKGKVWIANFIFTRCTGPCPMMTNRMSELNQSIGDDVKGVRLVTFTVDPEHDTPAVLKKYGENVSAEPKKWTFLTGSPEEVENVVVKGFLQPLAKDQKGEPLHSTRFVVVDKQGNMRAFRDGNDPELVQKLLIDIGALLREPHQG